MGKLFKTSDDIFEFINNAWLSTNCGMMGINLKVMSTPKAKQILKLSKESARTEFLVREDKIMTLVVYEKAWDLLDELSQNLLIKGVFSLINYDLEHDKITIDNRPYADLFNMRHSCDANGNEYLDKYDNALEIAAMAIDQVEREEEEAKNMEKERKQKKKND